MRILSRLLMLTLLAGTDWARASADAQVPDAVQAISRGVWENPARTEQFEVIFLVQNMTDSDQTASASLEVYPGLKLEGPAQIQATIAAQQQHLFKWPIVGRRADATRLKIYWNNTELDVPLAANLLVEPILEKAFTYPGEANRMRVRLHNIGNAVLAAGAAVEVSAGGGLALAGEAAQRLQEELAPGASAELTWELQASTPGQRSLTVTTRKAAGEAPVDTASIETAVIPQMELLATVPPLLWADNPASDNLLALARDNLELKFLKEEEGYRIFAVDGIDGVSRIRLAMGRSLGKVIYRDSGGDQERMLACQVEDSTDDSATFVDSWTDADGVNWTARVTFQIIENNQVEVNCSLAADGPRELLAFHSPFLMAGERETGIRKDSAHFPGIEWLTAEERSSSIVRPAKATLKRLERYVPHPNEIAVPVMGVTTDRRMVGLMWDPLQKWDGEHDRPAAVFASHNWLQGYNHHLMGLFLPAMPQWVERNRLEATHPYPLAPEKPLRLQFRIISAMDAEDLSPIWTWYETHGIPDPPAITRSIEEELQFWGFGEIPQVDLVDYYWYIKDSVLGGGEGDRRSIVGRSMEIVAEGMAWRKLQDEDGSWPIDWARDPGPAVQRRLIGGWPWREHGPLGAHVLSRYAPPGKTTIGTCTTHGGISGIYPDKASKLLQAARLSGRPDLIESAKLALDRISQFNRPEGAEIWEAPLHNTGQMGAGYAIKTFVEGYRLTGDRQWLECAEQWAWKGLPFLYTWDAGSDIVGKYTTLAYIGAAHGHYPFVGTPVSFTGVEYAKALAELSQYHEFSFPFDSISEGIILWALSTAKPPGSRTWAHWIDARNDRIINIGMEAYYWDDRPARALALLHRRLVIPETTVVAANGRNLHVTPEGQVLSAQWGDHRLSLRLKPRPPRKVSVATSGFAVAIGGLSAPPHAIEMIQAQKHSVPDFEFNQEYGLLLVHLDMLAAPWMELAEVSLIVDTRGE